MSADERDWSKDARHRGKNKERMIKDIQLLLIQNDYNIESVFEITKYAYENLQTNIEWLLNRKDDKMEKKIEGKSRTNEEHFFLIKNGSLYNFNGG